MIRICRKIATVTTYLEYCTQKNPRYSRKLVRSASIFSYFREQLHDLGKYYDSISWEMMEHFENPPQNKPTVCFPTHNDKILLPNQ